MDQIKLDTRQIVAEALSHMRKGAVNSLPVYDDGHFIGKITYSDLMTFLKHKEDTGNMHTYKLNFEIGTALVSIKQMKAEFHQVPVQDNFVKRLVVGLSSVAAIALVLLSLTWLFFNRKPAVPATQNYTVIPGLNKVVLGLANGEGITLNHGKEGVLISDNGVRYNDGTEVNSENFGEPSVNIPGHKNLMTVYTSNGGIYQITLPDGTRVWLNAASSLKFPATFSSSQRKVELTGEAYFEVAKVKHLSKRVPFIVASEGQEIEVLGTHFNVSAYTGDGAVRTTLLEGSVRVNPLFKVDKLSAGVDPSSLDPLEIEVNKKPALHDVILKPNQVSTLTSTGIAVKTVDAEEAVAWKNGEYIYRNSSLEDVMRTVSRWYDVEVVYQHKNTNNAILGGVISRTAEISEVLKILEVTANVHFKTQGRRITVIE